jgi:hypothetical protein
MFYLRRGVRERTTPIGALHRAIMRWGEAERTTSRLAVQRWVDGVAYVDVQARSFADFWTRQNEQALTGDGPLWVVLGDSTAQGLGASSQQPRLPPSRRRPPRRPAEDSHAALTCFDPAPGARGLMFPC